MTGTRVNGVQLYYEVHGDGPPVLGIHGTPSSALMWVDAARELAAVGRCVIYDRRGFGRSERTEPFDAVDLATHVEDAAALLADLGAAPAVVIGRSTGGLIALELARRHPDAVAALVLLEPALFTIDPDVAAWAAQLRRRVLEQAEDARVSASEAVFREFLGAASWEGLPQEVQQLFADASPAVLAEMNGHGLDLSDDPLELSADDLAGIGQPTLLVSAEDSPEPMRRVTERLADTLPNAEAALVTGGHLIHPAHPSILEFVGLANMR